MDAKTRVRSVFAAGCLAACFVGFLLEPASGQADCVGGGDRSNAMPLTDDLVAATRRTFAIPTSVPDADVKATAFFRCVKRSVWLCRSGANLSCDRSDVSRKSEGADQFCKNNPNSADVPMSATGHDTIYQWKCLGKNARISGKIADVDAMGFVVANWLKLSK